MCRIAMTAAALLATGLAALWWSVTRSGRTLTYEFVPRRVHWVQMIMHSSVYAYWGWYWREVYHEIPLILSQVAFLYVLDMLVCWSRRDKWILGFGPFPIIFSTNLFLWFRDDWFYLQFVMVALIVVVYIGLRLLVNSGVGNVIVATRENPQRAEMLDVIRRDIVKWTRVVKAANLKLGN